LLHASSGYQLSTDLLYYLKALYSCHLNRSPTGPLSTCQPKYIQHLFASSIVFDKQSPPSFAEFLQSICDLLFPSRPPRVRPNAHHQYSFYLPSFVLSVSCLYWICSNFVTEVRLRFTPRKRYNILSASLLTLT